MKRAFESPYFATNARLLVLYSYLRKHHPGFDEKYLQKEKLFQKLYPGKPYNGGLLRVLLREFSVVVEDFIMMERLRNDKQRRKKMLVSEYAERNLYEYFKKGTFELLEKKEGGFVPDMEHFMERVELLQAYSFHPLTNAYDKKDNSLEVLMDSLDAYFVLAKYRFSQVLNNKNTIFKKKAKYNFFEIIKEDRYGLSSENKLIQLYELLDNLHETNDEKYFFELKKELFPNIDQIKRTDRMIIYFMGLNYCARQINSGIHSFYKEQFEWYKEGLARNLLLDGEQMSDSTLNNIIVAACRLKEFIWAENFLEKYESKVSSQFRQDAIKFAKGTLLFHRNEFEKTLTCFSMHNFSPKYQPKVRVRILQTLFELFLIDKNYFLTMESYIESFRKYLNRNTFFSENKLRPILKYIQITGRLSKKIMNGQDKKTIRQWLKMIIESEANILGKSWFLDLLNKI